MATSTTFKRGDTFSFGCTVTLGSGTWSAACKLRDGRGELIDTATCTLTPPVAPATAHQLLLEVPAASTVLWPLAALYGDVQFTDTSVSPNVKTTSGTFTVTVIEAQTR